MTTQAGFPGTPDTRIRELVVVLLRVGLGAHLFHAGLLGYMARLMAGGPGGTPLPYLQIALGLALALGIFTTPSAFAAGLLIVFEPLVETAIMLSGGGNANGGGPLTFRNIVHANESAIHLVLAAVVLWFSPPGRNPWSLDGLLFGRHVPARPVRRPEEPPALPEALAPGERTSRYVSGRVEPTE